MNYKSDKELLFELCRFRSEVSDLTVFQNWIASNYIRLQPKVSPGYLLKLRRGDKQQVMKIVTGLVPSCVNCRDICPEGAFLTREAFSQCAASVAQRTRSGALTPIGPPPWFKPDDKHFGADSYFRCATCGAVWTLVLPEREDNGLWERLA